MEKNHENQLKVSISLRTQKKNSRKFTIKLREKKNPFSFCFENWNLFRRSRHFCCRFANQHERFVRAFINPEIHAAPKVGRNGRESDKKTVIKTNSQKNKSKKAFRKGMGWVTLLSSRLVSFCYKNCFLMFFVLNEKDFMTELRVNCKNYY